MARTTQKTIQEFNEAKFLELSNDIAKLNNIVNDLTYRLNNKSHLDEHLQKSHDKLSDKVDYLYEEQPRSVDKLHELTNTILKHDLKLETIDKDTDNHAKCLEDLDEKIGEVEFNVVEVKNKAEDINKQLLINIATVLELKEANRLIREELEQRSVLIEQSIQQVREPIVWLKNTGAVAKWFAAFASLIAAIIGLITYLSK